MKSLFGYLVLTTMLLVTSFVAVQCFAQRNDASLWASFALDKDINKRTQFNFKTQGRMRENWSKFDYAFFDFGFSRKIRKGIKFDFAYVFNTKRTFIGEGFVMLPRHQVYGTLRFSHKTGQFKFMNRNRVQTQLEDGQFTQETSPTDYFYRNKSTVRWRPNKTWMPYTSYEMYFRLSGFRANEPQIYRHRLSFGTYYYISKRRRIDFYYTWQLQQRRSQPDNLHVIGLSYERSLKSNAKLRENRARKSAKKRIKQNKDRYEEFERDPFMKW